MEMYISDIVYQGFMSPSSALMEGVVRRSNHVSEHGNELG